MSAVVLTFKLCHAWYGKQPWTEKHELLAWTFRQVFQIQLLLGLTLYIGFSPMVKAALIQWDTFLEHSVLRFWAIEHGPTMVLALLAFIAGKKMTDKREPHDKPKVMLLTMILVLLLMLAAIPWPGLQHGRPLFRLPP